MATAGERQSERFVSAILRRCRYNKRDAAKIRRADSPSLQHQSWPLLIAHGVDLKRPNSRLPHTIIAASIARTKARRNGKLTLGQALVKSFGDGRYHTGIQARLRRLLACNSLAEICRILPTLLPLIESRCGSNLDYVRLLGQLKRFRTNPEQVKSQWAMEVFNNKTGEPLNNVSEAGQRGAK